MIAALYPIITLPYLNAIIPDKHSYDIVNWSYGDINFE